MLEHPPIDVPAMSELEAESRLRADRYNVTALMAKADHRFLLNDHRGANSFYTALARLNQSGPEFDRAKAMVAWLGGRFKQHLLLTLDRAGFTETHRHPRFQKSLEMMLGMRERPVEYRQFPPSPLLYFYPDLPYVQFADPTVFAWRRKIEEGFTAMREEAVALLGDATDFRPYIKEQSARPQGDVHGLINNPDWSTFHLFENGAPVAEHVHKCPAIFEAVTRGVPLCMIGPRAPSIMLSLLKPGAKIPPHTGMVNCRYICHLPLVIPSGCGFRVGEQTRKWTEGELLLFDDSVEHEAWNDSDQNRLVLIFDVWRPELGDDEQAMVRTLFEAVDSYQ